MAPGTPPHTPEVHPSEGDGILNLWLKHCFVRHLVLSLLSSAVLASTVGARPTACPQGNATVAGIVTRVSDGSGVFQARVTLFTPNLTVFLETRTAADGTYDFSGIARGIYRLGVAARGFDYVELNSAVSSGPNAFNFGLVPENHVGFWQVIGNTLPELFDATDIAILRPTDGFVMFCHDTVDPVLFHPVTGQKIFPIGSGSEQGCMNASLLVDGSILMCGGQSPSNPGSFTNAIPWVKRFKPGNTWQQQSNMLLSVGRWYPGLARLNDGRFLIMGGGTSPNAQRTDTCELYDPATQNWSWTSTMNSPLEFPPCGLLYGGKVLRTWGTRPQLYDPATGTWADTGQFVYSNRQYPGHSDHSLSVLSDGRGLIVGLIRAGQNVAQMTEFYSPATGTWSAGTSPSLKRMQCEVVYLPDGHVLVQGGDTADTSGPEPNILGIVRRCDLFEPEPQTWRRVANTLQYREYHAVTLLVPDGRVITTGGTQIKFQYGPVSADIDAYSPPYLFRGVRPSLSNLSDNSPSRGQWITFDVAPATRLTRVVLMGVQSTTHWVEGGIPRRLELRVGQNGQTASVYVPTDPNIVPLGWYMLFGMVDDIPSPALFLRVDP